MGIINTETFIRGLHVYRIELLPGDVLYCKLDWFWMREFPERYSVSCFDQHNRKVGHLAKEVEQVIGMMLEFGKKTIVVKIPAAAVKHNAGELGIQIGKTFLFSLK